MPALSLLTAEALNAQTTSATFEVAGSTAALASGERYIVLYSGNSLADNSSSTVVEAEIAFGGVRHGFMRYSFGVAAAPDSANGGPVSGFFIADGNGSDVVAINHRRESGTGDVTTTVHVACIPIGALTLGIHYWFAEAANSDTLTNPAAGAGWVGSGDQVDVVPSATGIFLVMGSGEFEFTTGHSSADQARFRLRVTEDPAGAPTSYNLMRNTIAAPDIEGPEVAITGGSSFDYAGGQKFADVVSLVDGTTYRFELEREGVAGSANCGYRRERILVLDLSVWPEFFFSRDVDGQSGTDLTFATASAAAPSESISVVLSAAVAYANGNSYVRTYFDQDPAGAPVRIPASSGYGLALPSPGAALANDYGMINTQAHVSGVTGARDYALRFIADNNNCRVGHERGDFPGGVDDGVATVTIAWGMFHTVAAAQGGMSGSAAGSAASSAVANGSGALSGASAGSSGAAASTTAAASMSGVSDGSAGALSVGSGSGSLSGSSDGSAASSVSNATGVATPSSVLAFIGNSYTQNYGGLPALLEFYLGQRLVGNTVSADAVPHLGTTIANSGTDGWFPGFTLGMMALYPTIDASSSGSTDALDAIDSVADDAYDFVVITSGIRQEAEPGDASVSDDTAVARVVLPGAGGTGSQYEVCLEVTRRVVTQLRTTDGSTASAILRMTHEGYNANADADLSDVERVVRLLVLGARQLEAEGVVDLTVPEGYIFNRLQRGASGPVGSGLTSPVAAFASLTHTASLQPGGANVSWLHRSQGDSAPFILNGHQNAVAMIVSVWIFGYLFWGIDPRGDSTFSGDPSSFPAPFDEMLNATGTRIYGGQQSGAGSFPYDAVVNPGGPPDSDLDLDWSLATQAQIQDILVAAADDYTTGETEFDESSMTASSGGSASAGADLAGGGAMSAASAGSASPGASLSGSAALSAADIAGGSAANGIATGDAAMAGSSGGSSGAGAVGSASSGPAGYSGGGSAAAGSLSGTAAIDGASGGASGASGSAAALAVASGSSGGTATATADLEAATGPSTLNGVLGVTHRAAVRWGVVHR